MEQNGTLEQNENDDVLEFDYTGADEADNLAAMAENLKYAFFQCWPVYVRYKKDAGNEYSICTCSDSFSCFRRAS